VKKSDWGKSVKEARKGVTAYEKELGHKKRADDEESEEEDEEDDLGQDLLREVMRSSADDQPPADAPESVQTSPAAAEEDSEERPQPGKRKAAPEMAAEPKRVKTEPVKKFKVTEKEVVEVIYASPKMTIKQLIAKFKELLTDQQEKKQFQVIVKDVATLKAEGSDKIVYLKDSILYKYYPAQSVP